MSRKEKLTDHTFQLSLPESLYRLLRGAARRGDQSLAEVVRRAITFYLARLLASDGDLRSYVDEVLHIVDAHMNNVEELREEITKRGDEEGTLSPAAEEILGISADYRRAVNRLREDVERRFEVGGVWEPALRSSLLEQAEIEREKERQIEESLRKQKEQETKKRHEVCKPVFEKYDELVEKFPRDQETRHKEWEKWLSSPEGRAAELRMESVGMFMRDKPTSDGEGAE